MNSLGFQLILLFLVSNVKLSSTKELAKSSQAATGWSASRIEESSAESYSEESFTGENEDADTSRDQQQTAKQTPVNCDRVDSEFFRYLLKRYNKDNQQTGRTERLCSNLEYAATHCHRPTENLVSSLIQKSDYLDEDDFNFSQGIIRLCPLLLFKIQDQTCPPKLTDLRPAHDHPRPSAKYVWMFTLLFVTIISFCSLIGVVVMPFADSNSDSYKDAFNLFEGLAVGSLVASSLFHLLPQAFNLTNKNDDYLVKAMLIFGGIYLFFWSEILMKLVAEMKKRKKKKSISQANLQLLEDEMRINKLLSQSSQIVEVNGKGNLSRLNSLNENDIRLENRLENKLENRLENRLADDKLVVDGKEDKAERVVKSVKIEKGDDTGEQLHLSTRDHRAGSLITFVFCFSRNLEPQQIATVAWMIIFGGKELHLSTRDYRP